MRECRNMRLALRGRCAAAAATLVSAFLCVFQPTKADPLHALRFEGICNASAGVALAENLFVVADDEDKVVSRKLAYKPLTFRVYSLSRPGKPISIGVLPGEDIDPVVADNVSGEVDLEASAPLGGIVFWIGSHSSGSGGSQAPNRRRLFAVQFNMQGEQLKGTSKNPESHGSGNARSIASTGLPAAYKGGMGNFSRCPECETGGPCLWDPLGGSREGPQI